MLLSRRQFLRRSAAVSIGVPLLSLGAAVPVATSIIKPPRLKPGDTVGLVSPGGFISDAESITEIRDILAVLGLNTKAGRHVLDQRGYLGGGDVDRAADVNRMFADPEVNAILAMRGGWGSARILPLLDYDLIRSNPKILVGYSDITSLLIGIYARTGLVTFHGPVAISTWNAFTVDYFHRLLYNGEALTMSNPAEADNLFAVMGDPFATITPGRTQGRLIGGNLSVLSGIIGSGYLPEWAGHLLFLEETQEEPYRIDRMMAQLKLTGVLDQISGFIFGTCNECEPEDPAESLTLDEVLNDYIAPLGIPAWRGAMIGHVRDKFTVPIGIMAEMDASAGTIRLLESAVV